VEEEADEALYWLEVIAESGIAKPDGISALMVEARELLAIFTAVGRTTKAGGRRQIRNSKFEIRN
jgi:hypothetical protein